MSACPKARRQERSAAVIGRSPVPTADPVRAGGAVRALSGVRGRRGGPRLRQRWGWGWKHARAGSTAPAGGWCRVTATRGKGAAGSSDAVACAMSGVASSARRGGVRRGGQQAAPCPSRARHATGRIVLLGGRPRPGGATRPPPRGPAPRQSPWFTAHRAWRHPAAKVVRVGVAAVGHREARTPASVSSNPTRVCG